MDSNDKYNGFLKIIVCNCSNVPNPERSNSIDPYVNLNFQG
jgi:hypothetical protein